MELTKEDANIILNRLTLMDDFFTSYVLRSPIIMAHIINKLLNRYHVCIIDGHCITQLNLPNVLNKSVRLDSFFENNEYMINIEVSKFLQNVSVKRARYYSSALDTLTLSKGKSYLLAPISYVIFIANGPILENQEFVERIEAYSTEKGLPIKGNERYIVFVDALQYDDSEVGKMIHDFNYATPDDMQDPILKKAMEQIKKTPEGRTMAVDNLCNIFREYFKDEIEEEKSKSHEEGERAGEQRGEQRGQENTSKKILKMIQDGQTLDDIENYLKATLDQ